MTAVATWVRRHPVLCFFVAFAIFPWVVPYKSLATQVLIYGLFALGFNLLYGYTGMARAPVPWSGTTVLPNPDSAKAYRLFATVAYLRVKEIAESVLGSAMIYLNSHAVDFKTPELRVYLDRYLRGSDGSDAQARTKLIKLLWDAMKLPLSSCPSAS